MRTSVFKKIIDYVISKNIKIIKTFLNFPLSCKKHNSESDLSLNITEFIENNFSKQLLFTPCDKCIVI